MRARGPGGVLTRAPHHEHRLSRDTGAVDSTLQHAVPLKTAAFLVGHSRQQLRREIAAGRLRAFKQRWYTRLPDGRVYRRERWMISRRELAAWVRRQCHSSPAGERPAADEWWDTWLISFDCIAFTVSFTAILTGVSGRYIRAEIAAGRLRAFRQTVYVKAWGTTWRRQRWMIPWSAHAEWLLDRDDRARRCAAAGGPGAVRR